jgi:hypothetical protein
LYASRTLPLQRRKAPQLKHLLRSNPPHSPNPSASSTAHPSNVAVICRNPVPQPMENCAPRAAVPNPLQHGPTPHNPHPIRPSAKQSRWSPRGLSAYSAISFASHFRSGAQALSVARCRRRRSPAALESRACPSVTMPYRESKDDGIVKHPLPQGVWTRRLQGRCMRTRANEIKSEVPKASRELEVLFPTRLRFKLCYLQLHCW